MSPDLAAVIADVAWLPHRTEPGLQSLEFVCLDRERHRSVTFLEDAYFPPEFERVSFPLRDVVIAAAALPTRRPRFIFHSSMATSTLLTRMFDLPGTSMSLAEPIILNVLASLKRRRIDIRPTLGAILKLLLRPFGDGEVIVIKPGNSANVLIPDLVALAPSLRALAIEAPIRDFLRSVAKKGMTARVIYRRLFAILNRDRPLPTGFTTEDLFEQTDLQIAAMAWLQHHAEFATACNQFPEQFRTLDSATFLRSKEAAVSSLARHFDLQLDAKAISESDVFNRHSKELGRTFDEGTRQREHQATQAAFGDEIDKVSYWLEMTSGHIGLPIQLPRPLIEK